MKTAAIIAVFVLSSLVGIKPASAATCQVRIPYYKIDHIHAWNYNIPLACSVTKVVVKQSVRWGDGTAGDFSFKMRLPISGQRIKVSCQTSYNAVDVYGAHTQCKSGHMFVSYHIREV